MKDRTASFQVPLFAPTYQPRPPQWGGHGGLAPNLNRIYRVLKLAETDPYYFWHSPQWWGVFGTEAMGTSTLYWGEAFKLLEPVAEGAKQPTAYYLSERAKQLLAADPYFEATVGGGGVGSSSASPLLWVLHWWLVSSPCLSKSISWLLRQDRYRGYDQQGLLEKLLENAEGEASATVLKQEARMLLEMYLGNPLTSWKESFEHPFWDLGILRYDLMDAQVQGRQDHPKAYAKYEHELARMRERNNPFRVRTGSSKTPSVKPPALTAATLQKTKIRFSETSPPVLAEVMMYIVLDYVAGQVEGSQRQVGTFGIAHALYKSWDCPGILLGLSETAFQRALDQLKAQKRLLGLEVAYLPDAGGNVMSWSRLLEEMRQEMWDSVTR